MALKYNNIQNSYVVFTKVSSTLWRQLSDDQKLRNTLYFVIDGDNDDVGQLYLGSTLIADGSGVTSLPLKDLDGVDIKVIQDEDVLMFNMDTQMWENVNLPSYLGTLLTNFVGATEGNDGASGLVPQPTSNDINKFLKGDGTWADPNEKVREDILNLQETISVIVGTDKDKAIRTIATEEANIAADAAVARIVANAPGSFDTLKEIADWIDKHPNVSDITTMQTTVQNLSELINNETSGLVAMNTKVGELDGKVTSLDTTMRGFTTQVGELTAELASLNTQVSTNTTNIEDILERLVWKELIEE